MRQEPGHREEPPWDPYPRGPLVVVLSGPSGVGKDAVLQRLKRLKRPWHFVVTATTRAQRPGEIDGVDYIFIHPSRFQELVRQGELLEYAQVYGNWYGVPKDQVREALSKGMDVIVKADVQGAATIRERLPQSVLVFLAPPSTAELERRLRQRGTEITLDLQRRIETAKKEMEQLALFDYVVVNHNQGLDEAAARLDAIITAEKSRVMPRKVNL